MRHRWLLIPALLLTFLAAVTPPLDAQIPQQRGGTLQSAAVATGNGTTLDTSLMSAVTFQSSGTFVGTVTLEGSNDASNFNSLTCYSLDSATATSTMTSATIVRCNVTGIPVVRARVSAWTSGSITVRAQATSSQGNIRDTVTTISNVVTGQFRGTQTTAPTVGLVNGGGSMQALTASLLGGGSDSFMRIQVKDGLSSAQVSTDLMATFQTAWAAVPACVASADFPRSYAGYYISAVPPTTTTVNVKMSGGVGTAVTPTEDTASVWPPHSTVSVHCVGLQ